MPDAGRDPKRRSRGFERAAGLLATHIRKAGEGRGFAVSRLLTHWPEVVGEDIAALARPVRVTYGREGFGATLTLLVTGAAAPLVQMRLPDIRDRVNACYGYAAISHLKVTQTAAEGFAEAAAPYAAVPPRSAAGATEVSRATTTAADVADTGLREALERLGRNVLSKP